jgi:hypothetical protein
MYSVRNLEYLRSAKPTDAGYAVKLAEALRDIVKCGEMVEGQTNANASGNPAPPPPLQAVTVTPTSVGHHVSINHGSEFYRGAYYHVESSASPAFTNPFPVYSGPAREIDLATGSQKLYFQAFASYQTSDNTPPVFHGGTIPQAVTGGVNVPLGTSQGSGTGQPGQGLQGFGSAAFRSTTGKPPTRGTV